MSATEKVSYEINLSILFSELPLLERPAAAKAAGFDAVEFWWPFATATPSTEDVDAFVNAIEGAGVKLVGLNFFAGDMPGGERGLFSNPARTAELRESVAVLVEIAKRTGVRAFNALYGQRIEGVDAAEQDRVAIENIVFAANAIAEFGGLVLIEPLAAGINGAYPLETAQDAVAVVNKARAAGADNVAFLFDAFHLGSNDENLVEVVNQHAANIGHVQVADVPGRGQPGTGTVDFESVYAALIDNGYAGYVGLEYKAQGTTEESLAFLPVELRSAR